MAELLDLRPIWSQLSGLHFAKEALSDGEREILYTAEQLLKEVELLRKDRERIVKTLAAFERVRVSTNAPAPTVDDIIAVIKNLEEFEVDLAALEREQEKS